jgi:hypothetical protein
MIKINKFLVVLLVLGTTYSYSQVGIGTSSPSSSAQLELLSTDKGLLIPRLQLKSTFDSTSITNGNVESLLVYNTVDVSDVTKGFYYWTGASWERIMDKSSVEDLIPAGLKGDSAYEVWKSQSGNSNKTIADYLIFIKGEKGDKGDVILVEDVLNSTNKINALSANQGMILKGLIDANTAKKQSYIFTESYTETGGGSTHSLTKTVMPFAMSAHNFKVSLNGDVVSSTNVEYNAANNTIKVIGILLYHYDIVTVMYMTNE